MPRTITSKLVYILVDALRNYFTLFRVTYCDDIALIKLDTSFLEVPRIPEDVELQTEPIETSRDLSKH